MGLSFEWGFDSIVALLSIVVPLAAFIWEFGVVGRKRLGYRMQMDTLATDTAQSPYAHVLEELHDENGRRLIDPSFVLLRIENAGWLPIVEDDYLAPADDRTGIRVTFRGRRVAGVVVTELSDRELGPFFTAQAEGFGIGEELDAGLIKLPKVKLNPTAHYKVLAVLERSSGAPGDPFPGPVFSAGVSTRHSRWFAWVNRLARVGVAKTESHTFASKPALVGIGLLTLAVLAQASLTLFWREEAPPLDCVGGQLQLHGSSAFAPAVTAAAKEYVRLCSGKGASIPVNEGTFTNSTGGISNLKEAGEKAGIPGGEGLGNHMAFTDGPAIGTNPEVVARPVAYSLYALVVNKETNVHTLSPEEIRGIYNGDITNWSVINPEVNLPIRIINRHRGSGTRNALVQRLLKNVEPGESSVTNCAALVPDMPGSCEVDNTEIMLDETADIRGAIGYSEVSSAMTAKDVIKVNIGNKPPTLEGVEDGKYPYWQTEFAYTYGQPPADSIAAAFLRYLTDQGGKDILREFGNRPCAETEYPLVCEPMSLEPDASPSS